MTCTHGHSYCALCSAIQPIAIEQPKPKRTKSQKRRDRYIRRLKMTGRWIEKPKQ